MERRNTIQRDLVLEAVRAMKSHVTAEEVYNFIVKNHPHVSKGTVYRNLHILAEENEIKKVAIPDGCDRFDFTLSDHYHVKCIHCGDIHDVDMEALPNLIDKIREFHGVKYLDYDILFRGICSKCQIEERSRENG